jgi:hypothetical protein
MQYHDFTDSLEQASCPLGLDPCLQALWHDAQGDWTTAHEIVQAINGQTAARIHAYLHRKEGDDWNSRYWHRHAGTAFPEGLSLEAEREGLVRELTE